MDVSMEVNQVTEQQLSVDERRSMSRQTFRTIQRQTVVRRWWMRKWNGADDCGNVIGLSWSFGGESGRSCRNEAMVTMKQTTLMTTETEWCWLLHKSNGTTSIVRWRNRTEAATMKTTMTMTRWHWWLRKWKNTSIVRWRNQGEASIM